MANPFVDANVFLRFLTNDDPVKAERAEALFRDAVRGRRKLSTSLLVIAEIIRTLESFYKLEKPPIASMIEKILNTRNLECPGALLILTALDLYVHENIDFIDAYHAVFLREQAITQVFTYDRRHFSRIPWLEVLEPQPCPTDALGGPGEP